MKPPSIMPNALIHETSPYLLQHAYNPVQWYPWGEEALQKAIQQDKPILVSIGYSACHWCHVMEQESFEDETTAAIMNKHFINIKIDREERPDLDHIYMDAVQTMTGSGGWPLNVFLTPQKKPFYGGTYFPPQPVMNRASWKEVLQAVSTAFQNKRADIEKQAEGLTGHLLQSNDFGIAKNEEVPLLQDIDEACKHLLAQADTQWGGFGNAPKFPQTLSIQFLLRYYFFEKNRIADKAQAALQQALLSLDKMMDGGIYDQLGGGFARYSTDAEWLAPHFEKMLYDNALLLNVYADAYQLTNNEKYKKVIDDTIAFVQRELMHPNKGFFSALDADSEGEEGKFYGWAYEEIKELLGDDAAVFSAYYNVTQQGNWEHKNILRVLKPVDEIALAQNTTAEEVHRIINTGGVKLMAARDKRTRPGLDDKVILGWNALMNTALSKAFAATGNEQYRELAITNMQFLLKEFKKDDETLLHVWKDGTAKFPAFLDDHAYLIQALLHLYRITSDTQWLETASSLCQLVITNFSETSGYFYYTPIGQKDVIVRKKEVYDGATPSGNSVMAQNLFELSIYFDNKDWLQRVQEMIKGLSKVAVKYPTSFAAWLATLYQMIKGTREIVMIGGTEADAKELLHQYLPHSILMSASKANDNYPMLKDKIVTQPLAIFLCENYACKQPVFSVAELLKQMN